MLYYILMGVIGLLLGAISIRAGVRDIELKGMIALGMIEILIGLYFMAAAAW